MTTTDARAHHARWPWLVAAAVIATESAGAYLETARGTSPAAWIEELLYLAALSSFAIVGAVILSRIPGQLIGRLFLLMGLGGALTMFTEAWVLADPPLPARPWLAILNHAAIPMTLGPLAFVLLRFPDGALSSPRWRWVERLAIAALACLTVGSLLVPRFADYDGLRNPIGLSGTGDVFDGLAGIAWLSFLPAVFLAGLSQVFRFRRSRGQERERLKWFAFGGLLLAVGWVFLIFSFDDDTNDLGSRLLAVPYYVGFALFPVMSGIAILRYRLFDIDVAIRRTVVFGALAAFITVVYVAIVVGIGSAIGGGDEPNVALQIAATAVVGLAFQPVRERVTRFANRLVYGERATPYEVMAGLSRRVAETVSVPDALPEMARAAASGIGASAGRVRLLLPGGERVVRWPQDGEPPGDPDVAVPVLHAGRQIGEIAAWKPRGEPVSPGERGLLEDLAGHAGLTMHNVRLTEELAERASDLAAQSEDLRRSRERLVTARDVQRRRLERDIRDGPQRQLVAIAGSLRSAARTLERDPDTAAAALDELGERATSTLEGLRDLARGIFPPLLADEGIVRALEAHIRKSGANATVETTPELAGARFDAEVETTVYFCCLQAIQNAVRHAGNALTTVALTSVERSLAFSIRDRGPGFDLASVPRGMGLQIMEDRIAALGGELVVDTAPGRGTTVTGRIPVGDAA